MKPISPTASIRIKAGYQPDFVVREKASYEISECCLEDLSQTLVMESHSNVSGKHPNVMLRIHYFMKDGNIRQQLTSINISDPVTDGIRYVPPGQMEGIVTRIGFSCDSTDLAFSVEAFSKLKTT
jgi:hypothetical protein